MAIAHVLAGIAWDPQIRGFLAVLVGVVVLLGSVYLLLVTNLGARLGLPHRERRVLGLDARSWASIWWIYGTVGMLGERAALGGHRGRLPGRRAGRPRGGPRPRHLRAAAARGARRARGARTSTPTRAERRARPSAAGSCCPSPTRASARPRPRSTSTSPRTPTRSSRSTRADGLRHRVLLRARRQGEARRTTRAGSTASCTSSRPRSGAPATRRTTPSSRCSRSSSRRPSPGSRRPRPRPTETKPGRVRDHGARPRRRPLPGAPCSRSRRASCSACSASRCTAATSGSPRPAGCSPPPRRPDRRGPVPPRRGPGVLAVLFAGVSRARVEAAGPEQHHRRQALALRVRHRARPRDRPSASRCASTWSR